MVGEHVRMPDTRVCTHTHTLAPRSQSFQLCSPRFLIKWGIWWLEGDGGTCRQITVCLSSPLSTYTHCPLVLSPNQLLQVFPEVEKYILTFFFPLPFVKATQMDSRRHMNNVYNRCGGVSPCLAATTCGARGLGVVQRVMRCLQGSCCM